MLFYFKTKFMRKILTIVSLCLTLFVFSQTQYIKDFTPIIKDFSDFGFGSQGYMTDNVLPPRSCTFANAYQFGNQFGLYSKQFIDNQAYSLANNWDSLVFNFNYKTNGYGKNFKIQVEFLTGTNNYPYTKIKTFNVPDSQHVHFSIGAFFTQYHFNFKIWLIKQDTTLNNFTVNLSDLDVKGYLHYSAVGLNEISTLDDKIYWNNETIFFGERWLNRKYWITDIYGKVVFSGIVNSFRENLNLENGLYILNTEHTSEKMIIYSN